MSQKKLYGQIKNELHPDGFDEFIIQDPDNPSNSFNGEETVLLNANGIIKALKMKWFKGAKGDKGEPGDVVWGNVNVSSIGAALITATTTAAMRAVLGISAVGSSLISATTKSAQRALLELGNAATHSYGTTINSIAQGNDFRFVPPRCPIPLWSSTVPTGWYLCLTGDTDVLLSDGKKITIKEIVDNKMDVEVISYNEITKCFEPKKVINWMKNSAKKEEWIKLTLNKGDEKNKRHLDLTKNHPVLTQRGYVNAIDLVDSDKIYLYQDTLSEDGLQAILGIYLGDGSIEKTGRLKIIHSIKQDDYLKHISEKVNVNINYRQSTSGISKGFNYGIIGISLKTFSPELLSLTNGTRIITEKLLNRLSDVGLAYWYMDDGSISKDKRYPDYYRARLHTDGFTKEEIELIQNYFLKKGIKTNAYLNSWKRGYVIHFDRETQDLFYEMIAPYIIESMQYKLPDKFRRKTKDINFIEKNKVEFNFNKRELVTYHSSKKNISKYNWKYDIEVEDNHSFIANDFIVHNCDGTHGTPDLRGMFIIGASSYDLLGDTGGSRDAIVVTHVHSGNANSAGAHYHRSKIHSGSNMNNSGDNTDDRNVDANATIIERDTSTDGAHEHEVVVDETGESGANKNLPPYMAMNWIMYF